MCVVVALGATAASADSSVHVRLIFGPGVVPPAVRDAVILEAARVWQPYGIAVEAAGAAPCDATSLTLSVVVDLDSGIEGDRGLGSVRFGADGMPDMQLTLHHRTIVALAMGATALGQVARQWPVALRDQIVARSLGRALAHEIGHIVLRSPHHGTSGLMRARFAASALADPDGAGFRLAATDEARLHITKRAFLESAVPGDDPPGRSFTVTCNLAPVPAV